MADRPQRSANLFAVPSGLAWIALGAILTSTRPAIAFTPEEHAELASEVFAIVSEELMGSASDSLCFPLGYGESIGTAPPCARWSAFSRVERNEAKRDRSYAHYQVSFATVQQQLAKISGSGGLPDLGSEGHAQEEGTVVNFLVEHWQAMRLANRAGREQSGRTELLETCFLHEARAQVYLADAFSAGHMLVPRRTLLSWIHPINLQVVHDHYSDIGVYVANSRRQAWRAFGCGTLQWYSAPWHHVREACAASLREVLACFYAGCPESLRPEPLGRWLKGECQSCNPWAWVDEWLSSKGAVPLYTGLRLPSLTHIPVPITAAWSRASDSVRLGSEGQSLPVYERQYFPQFRERGQYASDLRPDEIRTLYSSQSFPAWAQLPAQTTEYAPVHFHQLLRIPASYQGALLVVGMGHRVLGAKVDQYTIVRAGWGILDELLGVEVLPDLRRLGIEAGYARGWNGSGDAVSGVATLEIAAPTIADFHFETGYAWGVRHPLNHRGPVLGFGLTTEAFRMPIVYLGAAVRLKYEIEYLNERTGGVALELVVH